MKITRQSPKTGKFNTMNIEVTQTQLRNYYMKNILAQEAFPHLNVVEREFIISGYTPEEQDEVFRDIDDEMNNKHTK